MLIGPLNAFPWVINGVVESWVSVKRLQAFIQLEELDLQQYYTQGMYSIPSYEYTIPRCYCRIRKKFYEMSSSLLLNRILS